MDDSIRKVNYGRFVDFMPPEPDYDSGLIGGHIYQSNAEKASLKTAGYEYYVTKSGSKLTIYDATLFEKLTACIKFVFEPKKKKVLGVRSDKKTYTNPYCNSTPQLGVKLDKDGNKVVDKDYYRNAEERALARGDRKAAREVYEKKKETEEELARMLEEASDKGNDSKSFTK